MDAANVDLKGFTESFYQKYTLSHLEPVLDTLRWLKRESTVWFEITNLVIPQANDDPGELKQMCDWLLASVGDLVPVHFTAFHPDFRLKDRPPTPHETLIAARAIALATGLKFVYTGNVVDPTRQSTYCPGCGTLVIGRDWYQITAYRLAGNRCATCGQIIPGRYEQTPGRWGRRRMPVHLID
jgi:pyruvate formate lyase activating enzyme